MGRRKLDEYDYLTAFNLLNKELYIINTNEIQKPPEENNNEIILQSETISPEEYVSKNSTYKELSNEAKEVIQLIINSPVELFELLFLTQKKAISLIKFKAILSKYWNSEFFANIIIMEIKDWLRQL